MGRCRRWVTVALACGVVIMSVGSCTTDATAIVTIMNGWEPSTVDPTRLPLGDDRVSLTTPARGVLLSCGAPDDTIGGAQRVGEWIDTAARTWNREQKTAVQGRVFWEQADYRESTSGDIRTLTTNVVPVMDPTGTFPVRASDPAHEIDRNPNAIRTGLITVDLPMRPTAADTPGCLGAGPIGMFRNGVVAFNSLDAGGRDAVAWEVQDECNGHPEMVGIYHYHAVAQCLLDRATGPSTTVGFAYDGYPIVVERDTAGRLPSNDDLDECHGRTSPIDLDGRIVTAYHYSATQEFPYYVGCFRGADPVRPAPPNPPDGGHH